MTLVCLLYRIAGWRMAPYTLISHTDMDDTLPIETQYLNRRSSDWGQSDDKELIC
jgi:hypothetical protein